MNVPDCYLGVWQRTLLRNARGEEDRTSRVFWLQTESLHGDIRLPERLPRTPEQRCSQGGFAGVTRVEAAICHWHRLLDFHPDSGIDLGRMNFVGTDELHETALDGSYLEVWQRLPGSQGQSEALWLSAEEGERNACLLRAGDFFLFAADRPQPLEGDGSLAERIADASTTQLEQILAMELSFGRIDPSGHAWRIELSTLPWRTGKALLLNPSPATPMREWPAERLLRLGAYPPSVGWCTAVLPLIRMAAEETPA